MEEIPFLLAGPILRRVEPSKIHIWIATSSSTQIQATLYSIAQNSKNRNNYVPLTSETIQKTIQSGKRIYIHLLTIHKNEHEFPTDTLIGYNLTFKHEGKVVDLNKLHLLDKENPNSIIYGDLKYPSFFIPKSEKSNILYGSCQKPHGKGNNAFISADISIESHYQSIRERPSALFLLGDQIYADDVADSFFSVICSLKSKLVGEMIDPFRTVDPYLNQEPYRSSLEKVHSRQFTAKHFAKFTSGKSDNHLFHFSEYAVMYLLTLGPSLWEGKTEENLLPSFSELLESDQLYLKYTNQTNDVLKKELIRHYEQYEEEVAEIIPYVLSLGKTRRVMANTPTYMIFDDHDITDDWNISYDWVQSVYQSSLGKHVVSHGLTAYLLFQAWGNDPKALESMVEDLYHFMKEYREHSVFSEDWMRRILNFHNWSFVAPTNPKALFLNTRTMRAYDLQPKAIRLFNKIEEGQRASQLIGNQGWDIVNQTLEQSEWKEGEPLLIISPTPFYGIDMIESFLKDYVYPLHVLGLPVLNDLDFEAWKYNGEGFTHFLTQIMNWNPSSCIILSGDVHYASAVRSRVTNKQNEQITIQQYTSSPIHNMSFSGIWGVLMRFVVLLHSLHVHTRTINRYCDQEYLISTDEPIRQKNIIWHEEIEYLTSRNGATIEFDNNIGWLSFHPNIDDKGSILQYANGKSKRIDFN